MLVAAYNYDTDIAVERRERFMLGIQEGIEHAAVITGMCTLECG